MKRLTCFLLLAVSSIFVCSAQQSPDVRDSASDPHTVQAGERFFIHFSAEVKESSKVLLQWDIDSSMEGDYFIIERASDGGAYETIGALVSNLGKLHYELLDQAAPNGTDLYRIRYTSQKGVEFYSKSAELSISGEVDFKFYPNPVDKLFIVRTEHMIQLDIIDNSGAVRLSKRLQPGIQVINAASLEHGIYILRVTDKESNRAISRQLVKN